MPVRSAPGRRLSGGGLYSTARDYARFLRMLLNQGEIDGARILAPETVAMMLRNATYDAFERGVYHLVQARK